MKFLPLLGKQLKDEAVIEVLEWGEMEVVYEFDRLHENQPDRYWAVAKDLGFQMGFDAHQTLEVIFLYAAPADGFSAVDRSDCDITFFASVVEVENYGARVKVRVAKGEAEFLGVRRHWAKLDDGDRTLHYEYQGSLLRVVTISKVN
jgi:hypothetical protein